MIVPILSGRPIILKFFLTNEYALRAFRVNTIDYLLNPPEIFDVKRALDKLKRFSMSSGFIDNEFKT
jgi:hypothetical protein